MCDPERSASPSPHRPEREALRDGETGSEAPIRLSIMWAEGDDPFANLALEEVLADATDTDEVILYLWQNARTIVIGRNQNPWRECRVEEFESDGGRIARRRSGGGAVFQDRGNLNFTFIAHDLHYNVERQCRIVCAAVRSFGLDAHLTGRNDLTIGTAKFSGNAFSHRGGVHCHHGTLMMGVNTESLGYYLAVDPRKLAAKGIASVRSRVVNLADLDARITPQTLGDALVVSAAADYGTPAESFDRTRLDAAALAERTRFFESREWRFGSTPPFTHRFDGRFTWGGIDVNLAVKDGRIATARVYSDALDADFIDRIAKTLSGCPYEVAAIERHLRASVAATSTEALEDVLSFIQKNLV